MRGPERFDWGVAGVWVRFIAARSAHYRRSVLAAGVSKPAPRPGTDSGEKLYDAWLNTDMTSNASSFGLTSLPPSGRATRPIRSPEAARGMTHGPDAR